MRQLKVQYNENEDCIAVGLPQTMPPCKDYDWDSVCECGEHHETLYNQKYPGELSTPENLEDIYSELQRLLYCTDRLNDVDVITTPFGVIEIKEGDIYVR